MADVVRPLDGTQDAEAGRQAITLAIADLVDVDGDADILALTGEQVELITERFVSYDICHRVELDVGKAIVDAAPSPVVGVRRLDELKSYVHETVAARFRAHKQSGAQLTQSTARTLIKEVIQEVFEVFEEYLS